MARALEPSPEFGRLRSALDRMRAERRGARFDATVYRAAHPKYAGMPELVSGAGARRRGSRWNPPGSVSVLHAALTPEGALAEAMAGRRRYGLPDKAALPLVIRGIRVRAARVLDLCDGA